MDGKRREEEILNQTHDQIEDAVVRELETDRGGSKTGPEKAREKEEETPDVSETVFSTGYRNEGRTENGSGNRYTEYRFTNPHMPDEPETKKKGSFWRKALAAVALGLIFGGCVGAGLYAASLVTGSGRNGEVASRELELFDEGADASALSANTMEAEGRVVTTTAAETVAAGRGEKGRPAAPNYGLDVADVAELVMPSVVAITSDYTAMTRDFWGQAYQQEAEASGSGFIVGDNGEELLIATNQHVVSDADKLGVQFIDGAEAEARLKGQDEEADLAVIAVEKADLKKDTLDAISVAVLGDSDSLRVGQTTIAIGNALGYGQSVTVGVVSALDRELKLDNGSHKLIQTDAAINPGNSGGALLDINGHVIGINEAKLASSGVEGMGYAIPISRAKPVIDELMNQSTKTRVDEKNRGYLGISGVDVTTDVSEQYNMPRGVYVSRVGDGLAADRAGIRKGDIITKFDGQTIQTMSQLQSLIEYYEAGQQVEVTVQAPVEDGYGYEEKNLKVTLGGSMADQILQESGEDSREEDSGDRDQDEESGMNGDEDDSYYVPNIEDLFRYFGRQW